MILMPFTSSRYGHSHRYIRNGHCIESHGLNYRRASDAKSSRISQLGAIAEVPLRYKNGFRLSFINETNIETGASVTCKTTGVLENSMNFPRRAHQLYRAGGTETVIRHGKRKILSYFDPFYQRLKPPYRFYSVFPPQARNSICL